MSVHSDFKYDAFLSHSSKDKDKVRELAARLKSDGVRVWLDEWEIGPGDSIPAKIEDGLEHSRVLVLCMSAEALAADWPQLESHTFRFKDPLNHNRRFILLRLDDAPIEGSLAQFSYIDWRPEHRETKYPKLLDGCRNLETTALDHSTAGVQPFEKLGTSGDLSISLASDKPVLVFTDGTSVVFWDFVLGNRTTKSHSGSSLCSILVHNAERQQSFGELVGYHCRTVVGQQRTGKTTFLNRLRKPMDQVFGGLRKIPLKMTAQARVVIQNAQRDGVFPLSAIGDHFEGSMMEVEMPQGSDILGFIAANLPVFTAAGCTLFSRAPFWLPSLAHHPTGLHETFYGGVGA